MARLYRVVIQVSDIDRAEAYYAALLGTPGQRVSPGRHYFDCDGTILACFDPRADGDDFAAQPAVDHVYLAVDELEAAYKRARELDGAWIEGAIETRPWGERSFYAKDPFGNPLCIVDAATIYTGRRETWVKRSFDFDPSIDSPDRLLDRLFSTPDRIVSAVTGADPSLLVQRDGARWSIQENVGHLLDLEDLLGGRVEDFTSQATVLRAADMTNSRTHGANHNAGSFDEILESFRSVRHSLVDELRQLDGEFFARVAQHPRLNVPMRVVDMLYFHCEHDDHHLDRIAELRLKQKATEAD